MVWFVFAGCERPPASVSPPPPTGSDTSATTPKPPPDGDPALYFVGDRPKNVLMISIDTTRKDHFGTYSETVYTPFFAEKMAEGVTLDDHVQCSNWTFASTSCTLNGSTHEETGYAPSLTASPRLPLPDSPSLAVRLQAAGYHTILVSSNGWLGTEWNNAQGYVEAEPPGTGVASGIVEDGMTRLGAAIAGGADKWLLHLHFVEPHPPYNPPEAYLAEAAKLDPLPPEWDLSTQPGHYEVTYQWPELSPEEQALLEAHLRLRYQGELRWLDDQMRELWATLDAAGYLDDTLVVVWTDHGEQFWEHGQQTHAWHLYAEENDAVAFFWAKNLPQRAWAEPTHGVDVAPTILQAVGVDPVMTDPWWSGYVLGTAPDHRPRFQMTVGRAGAIQSVLLDDWKLTFNFAGNVRLHDRRSDPRELADLYPTTPLDDPRLLELWGLLLPRIRLLDPLVPNPLTLPPELPQ